MAKTKLAVGNLEKIDPRFLKAFAFAATLVAFAWLVLSHAWFSDDAYFSFRTIDNFINGYGLTWNVAERVQVFTHPLWVLLLSIPYYFSHEIYLTTIFTSLILTLVLIGLVVLVGAKNFWRGLAAGLLLGLSTAFVDYSSPGLENPLSHLLLGGFLILFFREGTSSRKLFWLALIAALGTVNRLDTALFYFPPLLYEWTRQKNKWRGTGMLALGLLPLFAWEIFSVVYYGFPFPNTYYAKAQNYIGLKESIWAGLNYLYFTLKFDPVTWFVIAAALITTVWQKTRAGLSVAAGIVLYLFYILSIGGDFMGGRFISSAYLAGVLVLLAYLLPKLSLKKHWALIPAALLLSLVATSPPYLLYPKDFRTSRWPLVGNVVVDERREFYSTNFVRLEMFHEFNTDPAHTVINNVAYLVRSVFRGTAFRTEAEHDWIDLGLDLQERAAAEGRIVTVSEGNGLTGFYAGPNVHFIQGLALTDPFLARLPPLYYPNWRSGHFIRLIPRGYTEIEEGTQSSLSDPVLDNYFQKIRLVTQGLLFTTERWQAIWELNTGGFEDFLPNYEDRFRFPNLRRLTADSSNSLQIEDSGLAFNGKKGTGLQIDFDHLVFAQRLEITLSGGDSFELQYLGADGNAVGSNSLISDQTDGVEIYTVEIPQSVSRTGFAAIRLLPIRALYTLADSEYSIFGFALITPQ
jgi:arabinofuranosyltransferase